MTKFDKEVDKGERKRQERMSKLQEEIAVQQQQYDKLEAASKSASEVTASLSADIQPTLTAFQAKLSVGASTAEAYLVSLSPFLEVALWPMTSSRQLVYDYFEMKAKAKELDELRAREAEKEALVNKSVVVVEEEVEMSDTPTPDGEVMSVGVTLVLGLCIALGVRHTFNEYTKGEYTPFATGASGECEANEVEAM